MTQEKLVPMVVDHFCEWLVSQLDDVLHYTCSESGNAPDVLISKKSLIKLIDNIKEDYHNEEEVQVIIEELENQLEI